MVTCHFHQRGFTLKGQRFKACGVAYHMECLRVGEPFVTRRDDEGGLSFPSQAVPPIFICESCTVRSVLGRETWSLSDHNLMALERMRILDVAHSWAPGTYSTYRPFVKAINAFQMKYQVSILKAPYLDHPPSDSIIPLMWCHEAYSLRQGRTRSTGDPTMSRVRFATVRQLRSAVAHWESSLLAITQPGKGHFDQSKRLLLQECRSTDTACFTLFARGLAARTGTEAKPSKSLLSRHIAHLDSELYQMYCQEQDPVNRREVALAGLLNVALWLGWLRSREALDMEWADLTLTLPADGPTLDLPPHTGAVQLRLRPETKSDRSLRADVIMAYSTKSGLAIGRWLLRCAREHPTQTPTLWQAHQKVFLHCDDSPWTSLEFRERYLYPSLRRQRMEGDPYLLTLDNHQEESLEEAFWSLGSYRNGARSHVSRTRMENGVRLRKATPEEVYEHARWRKRRNNEAIDKIYQQWTPRDRIAITQECM